MHLHRQLPKLRSSRNTVLRSFFFPRQGWARLPSRGDSSRLPGGGIQLYHSIVPLLVHKIQGYLNRFQRSHLKQLTPLNSTSIMWGKNLLTVSSVPSLMMSWKCTELKCTCSTKYNYAILIFYGTLETWRNSAKHRGSKTNELQLCCAVKNTPARSVCAHTGGCIQTTWPFPDCLLYFIQGFASPSGPCSHFFAFSWWHQLTTKTSI